MKSVEASPPPVNSMTHVPIDLARLKRQHGLHRAAQTLADATLCQRGERPLSLSQMHPDEREWFKQTARHLIEVYELVTQPEREPDSIREKREVEERRLAQSAAQRQDIARGRARVASIERGHDLGSWRAYGDHGQLGATGVLASCTRCSRTVFVNLSTDPVGIAGPAIEEGCLVAAGTENL